MHAGGSSFEMNTNLQPRQPQPSSIGGQDAPSLQRNESSRSILSMARDAVGSNLAEELGDSYQNLHDSSGSGWGDSRGGGGGSIAGKGGGGLGAALAQHKLKMQGSSNSSQDKDADAASTYSDFSTGRCYHDIAGKTNVLMEDKELVSFFFPSHLVIVCHNCPNEFVYVHNYSHMSFVDTAAPLALSHISPKCSMPSFRPVSRKRASGLGSASRWRCRSSWRRMSAMPTWRGSRRPSDRRNWRPPVAEGRASAAAGAYESGSAVWAASSTDHGSH